MARLNEGGEYDDRVNTPSSLTSIINQNVVYLPVFYRGHNLSTTDQPTVYSAKYTNDNPGVVSHTVTPTQEPAEYQAIVDDNNVDHSVVTPNPVANDDVKSVVPADPAPSHKQCVIVSLPRTIQPRQFDNLVLVSVGAFRISLDHASGIIFDATCICSPDILIEASPPGSGYHILSLNAEQTQYILTSYSPGTQSMMLQGSPGAQHLPKVKEKIMDTASETNITCQNSKRSSKPAVQRSLLNIQREDLRASDVLDKGENQRQQHHSFEEREEQMCPIESAGTPVKEPLYTYALKYIGDGNILQQFQFIEEHPEDLVQGVSPEPAQWNTSKGAKKEGAYFGVPGNIIREYYNCEEQEDDLVGSMNPSRRQQKPQKMLETRQPKPSKANSVNQIKHKKGQGRRSLDIGQDLHRNKKKPIGKPSDKMRRASRKTSSHEHSPLCIPGSEQRDVGQELGSTLGTKYHSKGKEGIKHQEIHDITHEDSGDDVDGIGDEVQQVHAQMRIPATGQRDTVQVNEPIEESQYGLPSCMGISNEFSYVRLLAEVFAANGRKPVIGLLRRDLVKGEFLVRERTEVLRRAAASVTIGVTVSRGEAEERSEEQTEDRRHAAIRISLPPPIFVDATKHLHASDYPKIIELLGNIDDLPSEYHIPGYFVDGVAYFKMSKYDESRTHFSKCESLAIGENRNGDIMLCNAYLGDIEYSIKVFLKAAGHYKRSIRYYSTEGVAVMFKLTPPTLSAIYAKQASSYRNIAKTLEAVQNYKKAIDVALIDRDRLSACTSLGNLYQSMGENSSALEQYEQSIKLATVLSDQVSLGWAHGNIGNAYLGLNRKDEALHHLHKSLDLAVEYERTPQAIGRTYNNLGTAYQSLNNLDKAEEYYDLALSQAIFGNDKAGQARVYGNIGNVHMLRKNYERAIPHYGEVLQLSEDTSTISTAQHNRGCAYYEWATSFCHKRSLSPEPSLHGPDCDVDSCLRSIPFKAKELYSKGVSDLKEVVKYHEGRFNDIKGSTKGLSLSVSLFESNSRTFHRLQDCLINLHRWEEALVVAEKSRARTLGELMLNRKGDKLRHTVTSPLTFDQIADIVRSQRCPLVYLSYTGARLIGWVFVLSSGKVSMNSFEVPLTDDQFEGKSLDYHLRYSLTEKLVERSFEMYQTIVYNEETSSPVQILYDLVAMPVTTFLRRQSTSVLDAQQVICVSDSYTCLLPLTCLLDRRTGTFFGDQFYFKLAPSLLSLGIMSQLPEVTVDLHGDQYDFCIIGDPNIPPFTLNGDVWALGKLPYAGREADWVAYALNTTPIKGEHATKTALLNRSMSAKVIHIATHGSASAGFLAFSTFFTAAKSGSRIKVTPENVLLYPADVESLSISPALVVLSSCDSARGTVKADGIQGMARAFILAGAQSVLTTLWKVPDESASVFMQFFYQYLLDEMPSSLALHKATLSVRCYAKYSQYIHWSGYQLTGQDVRFHKNETTSNSILVKRLGVASMFPCLQEIKKLEKALVNNPTLPTDVQIIQDCPGMKSSEIVIDFITSFHGKFSAIFWINCNQQSLLKASISCIEEVIGCEVLKLAVSAAKPALFVFDDLSDLPDSEDLLRLLKNPHVHIIVFHKSYVSTDKLVKEVDRKLVRGCSVIQSAPLTTIHSSQRIIHSFMVDYNLTPTNNDQLVFEKVAEFTAGSPSLVEIASQIVCSCFEQKQDSPIQYLAELLSLKVSSTKVHQSSCQIASRSASRKSELQGYVKKTSLSDSYDWATNTEYDSWDSIMALVDGCNLSPEETLLLHSLSVFSCPIPYSLVVELGSMIADSTQKPSLAGTLHYKLMKFKLLLDYPHPVVLHESVLTDGNQQDDFELVRLPHHVSHCIWKSLEEIDQVVVLSLVYHTLNIWHQRRSLKKFSTRCLFSGLCSSLLEMCDSNFTLIGKKCYQEIYSLFLSCTI